MYFDKQMNFLTSGFQQISTAAQMNKELVEWDLPPNRRKRLACA
jgi:hypothetical protein